MVKVEYKYTLREILLGLEGYHMLAEGASLGEVAAAYSGRGSDKEAFGSMSSHVNCDAYFVSGCILKADLDRAIDNLDPSKGWLAFSTKYTCLSTEWDYFIRTLNKEQRLILGVADGIGHNSIVGDILRKMVLFLNKAKKT